MATITKTPPEVATNGHGSTEPGQAIPEPSPARAARRTMGQDLGVAFYRSFPGLVVILGLGILTMLGIWARFGDHGTAGKAAAPAAAAQHAKVSLMDFMVMPKAVHAQPNAPLQIQLTNGGPSVHALSVDAGGKVVTSPMLSAGDSATITVPPLPAGRYSMWCPVPGHEEAGMEGTLVVGGAGAGASTGSTSSGMGNMTAAQMAAQEKATTSSFPAKTRGQGDQVLSPTVVGGVKVFELDAAPVRWEVSPGKFVQGFAYNGEIPGPEIRVHQGDRVRVVLRNDLPQPTVIHFHGLTVPNAMDGVPYITQDPVMPGQSFTYEFRVVDPPGTYIYHSHMNALEQVGKGLFGLFVVEPKHPSWDVEAPIVLSDGDLGYTIDGKGFPATSPIVANLGQRVLIRFANLGQMLHPMHLHGFHFQVLSEDGRTLRHPYSVDTLVIAPGQRYDVLVRANHLGVWAFHCHILSHVEGPQGMFGMVTALIVQK